MPIPKLAITAAMTLANMALTQSRHIEGQRLDDLTVTVADYGTPLPDVFGTPRIEGCPIIWAEPLREVKREAKTKGGKYNEYTYFGTWAVALAAHEIDGLRRLWMDKHLVLDFSGAGPITPFPIGVTQTEKKGSSFQSASLSDHIALYLGTEDQEVDERIAATEEAKHGPGAATAYRGIAYIVFKDVPLEKFGNRIPQISAEVVRNATASFPKESKSVTTEAPTSLRKLGFSSDRSRLIFAGDDQDYEIWDIAGRQQIIEGSTPYPLGGNGGFGGIGVYGDGRWTSLRTGITDTKVITFTADGISYGVTDLGGTSETQEDIYVLQDGRGRESYYTTTDFVSQTYFFVDDVKLDWADYGSGRPDAWFVDLYGDIWVMVRGSTTMKFRRWVNCGERGGADVIEVTGLPAYSLSQEQAAKPYGAVHYRDADRDQFVFWWEAKLYAVDIEDGAILATSEATNLNLYHSGKQLRWMTPGAASIWMSGGSGVVEIDLADLSTIRTYSLGASGPWGSVSTSGVIYNEQLHALIAPNGSDKIHFLYLDRIEGAGMTLGAIAAIDADACGVSDYDFSDLDQLVEGWSATPGPATARLEPLFDAYDCDIAMHDFTVVGCKRTGVATGALATEWAAESDLRYNIRVRGAAELPLSLTYNFADTEADQQPNNVRSPRAREATGAREERVIDMSTLAGAPDDIRPLADRHFRRLWNSRREAEWSRTFREIALEPCDVKTLEFDGEEWTARLVRMTVKADDTIATEWVYDDPALALLDGPAGASADGRRESAIYVASPSKAFALDIPFITDADAGSNPVMYMAIGPYSASFPGGSIYQAIGGEYVDEVQSVGSDRGATWGYATGTLGDVPEPGLWDRGNAINVNFVNGAPTSTSEAAIDANPSLNMVAIKSGDEWELVNFTTATLQGNGTYTLSGLKRGRRGTEHATGGHAKGDEVLLLSAAEEEEFGLSDVGTSLAFKAITSGRTELGAFPAEVDFAGASLKPLAPVHQQAVKEANGDWTVTAVRRTRVGGAWTSGSTIPVSEASEAYEIELGDGITTVTKAVAGSGTGMVSYTWDVATQTADTGGEVAEGDLELTIYQMSDAVGRGYPAALAA